MSRVINVFELAASPFSVGLLYDVTDIDPNSTFLDIQCHVECIVCVYEYTVSRFKTKSRNYH